MSQWVIQRDPRFFDDPLAFRPERWDDNLAKKIHRYAYFPFGGGPRICIGNGFAMMEAVLLLATIARRFRPRVPSRCPSHPAADHDAPGPGRDPRRPGSPPLSRASDRRPIASILVQEDADAPDRLPPAGVRPDAPRSRSWHSGCSDWITVGPFGRPPPLHLSCHGSKP